MAKNKQMNLLLQRILSKLKRQQSKTIKKYYYLELLVLKSILHLSKSEIPFKKSETAILFLLSN